MIARGLACAAALALALSGCGPDSGDADMPVLTVTGALDAANRPAFDPATDRYFAWLGVDFPSARALTRTQLASLPQHVIHVQDEPLPPGAYEGPLLGDVLDLAGAAHGAQTVTAFALDGYSALIPVDGLRGSDPAIYALTRDGQPLPLGGMGPGAIVFPDQSGASPDWYVWGLVLIEVDAD